MIVFEKVKLFAKDSSSLLLRAKALDTSRKFVPTQTFELSRIVQHAPIVIAICFPGGNQKKLLIDSASTIGEAINAVSDKLEILDCSSYAIYKVILFPLPPLPNSFLFKGHWKY